MKKLLLVPLIVAGLISGCGGGGGGAGAGGGAPAITVAITPGTAQNIIQGQSVNFTAAVSNDTNNKGVTWTLSGTGCTGAACGTLTNVTSTSVTYNAPAIVSANLVVTVTATSVSDTSKSASATLRITATSGAKNNLLSGPYVFSFNGWNDANGMFQAVGSFVADGNGNISSGVVDSNGVGQTHQTLTILASGGTSATNYSIGSDNRGIMTWDFGGGKAVTFALAIRNNGKGRLIEFDDTTGTTGTRGAGSFTQQTGGPFSKTQFTGDFAFGGSGADSNNNRFGVIGRFHADGNNTISAGDEDTSQFGTSNSDLPFAGSFTPPDPTTGRGTFTVTVGSQTFNFAYYIVAVGPPAEIRFQSTDTVDATGHALVNGAMLSQTGPFSAASLNGTGIFARTGFDVSHNFTNTAIGVITGTGSSSSSDGTFTGVSDQNSDADPTRFNVAISGTYTVNSNGMGVVIVTSPPGLSPTSIAMVGTLTAFTLEGTQAIPIHDVQVGLLEPQSGSNFTNASVSGTFVGGSAEPATTQTDVEVGVFTLTPTGGSTTDGTISGTEDRSSTGGLRNGQAFTANYTVALNGRVTITVTSSGGRTSIAWIRDAKHLVAMGMGDPNTAIIILDIE